MTAMLPCVPFIHALLYLTTGQQVAYRPALRVMKSVENIKLWKILAMFKLYLPTRH